MISSRFAPGPSRHRQSESSAYGVIRSVAAVAALVIGTSLIIPVVPQAAAAIEPLPPGDTFEVSNMNDSGAGSLRAAMTSARANDNTQNVDRIVFLPGGPATIMLTSALPPIDEPLFIDGFSRRGLGASGPPQIELNGAGAGANAVGLRISSNHSTVVALAINRFRDGVNITGGGHNTLTGNYIGTDLAGFAEGNRFEGVAVVDSADNLIENNVISANLRVGLALSNGGSVRNKVIGNRIGTDASGERSTDVAGKTLGNGTDGVLISQEALPGKISASQNVIGGTLAGESNVISGNGESGVEIFLNAHHNLVQGNFIGTNARGNVPLPNLGAGVLVGDSPNNVVGLTPAHLLAEMGPGFGNIIAGNGRSGVEITCAGSVGNTVAGNHIGVDASGTQPVGNLNGVLVSGSRFCAGTPSETAIGPDNVVSANARDGVQAFGAARTTVTGNFVGTDLTGTRVFNTAGLSLGNSRHGVSVFDSVGTRIGSTTAGNVIGGNGGHGVHVSIGDLAAGSSDTVILNNEIGVDAAGTIDLGNLLNGVSIVDSRTTTVGGLGADEANRIANSGSGCPTPPVGCGAGVSIRGDSSSGNRVSGNSIHTNVGLGIDIGADKEDENDSPADADVGANGKLNTPEITSVRVVKKNVFGIELVKTEIRGFLRTAPGTYNIELFKNTAASPTDHAELGEGATYIEESPGPVVVDSSGKATFEAVIFAYDMPLGEFITATATDASGNTSEFSHDADNDALYDNWELDGVNGDGIGPVDLVLDGANPLHKDVYVEADAMVGRGFTNPEFTDVVNAFAAAPAGSVRNPDRTPGVNLHISHPDNGLALEAWPTDWWNKFNALKEVCFGDPPQPSCHDNPVPAPTNAPRSPANEARFKTHHYAIIADSFDVETNPPGPGLSGGEAESNGNDFFVTLGTAYPIGGKAESEMRSATFMHELGHNLGLGHGGTKENGEPDKINYKPNYHSVMNYTWQWRSPCIKGWDLAYSDQELPTLNEGSLNEGFGIGGKPGNTTYIGPAKHDTDDPCEGGVPIARIAPESGPVDWNGTDGDQEVGAHADVNNVLNVAETSPGEILHGHEDWSHLDYFFREGVDYSDSAHVNTADDEMPTSSFMSRSIDVSGNGITIADGDMTPDATDGTDFGTVTAGTSATRVFTVTNSGNIDIHLNSVPPVEILGTDAADFEITVSPAAIVPGFGASTTFEVSFRPSSAGVKVATLRIANDSMEPGEDIYEFAVTGTGEASSLSAGFTTTSSGRNVALLEAGTTVLSVSSQDSTNRFSPQNMINYSPTDNPWLTAAGQTTGQYTVLQLAAGGTYLIDRVRLMPDTRSTARVKDFAIDVSTTTTDDAAFTTVLTATAADSATLQDFQLPQPTEAKYVKYRPLNNRGGTQIGTRQLKIMTSTEGGSEVGFHDHTASPAHPITAWSWQFGDGTSSTEQNPVHTYAAPGTYNVTLVVTDSTGHASTVTHTQRVLAPPTAAINHTPAEPDEGQLVTFTAPSSDPDGGPIVWLAWDWGDGSTPTASSPAGATFTHRYNDSLPYIVTLVAVDAQEQTVEVQRTVTPRNLAPTATFTAPRIAAPGQNFTLEMRRTGTTDAGGDISTLHYAFDCGTGYGPAEPTLVNPVSASCPSTGTPTYSVKAKVIDKEGAFSEYTAIVTTATIELVPVDTVTLPGQQVLLTATVRDTSNQAITGLPLHLTVTGDNPSVVNAITNATGVANFNVAGPISGIDTAAAKETSQTATSNTVTIIRRPASQADVLVLGTTVTSPTTSVEVRQALAAGFSVEVVGANGWRAKTTSEFSRYKSIVLGDYAAEPGDGGTYTPASDTRGIWGPAVNGNVYLISADVASQDIEGIQPNKMDPLVNRAIRFTADEAGRTGMYVSVRGGLGPLLDAFGEGFQFQTRICGPSHIVAPTHPAMVGLTDADLPTGDNECRFGFQPQAWPIGFESLAVEIIPQNPAFPGIPFILARGPAQTPPGTLALSPDTSTGIIGHPQTLTATATNGGTPAAGANIRFAVPSGPNAGRIADVAAAPDGTATFTYTGTDVGTDTVEASFVDARGVTVTSSQVTVTWQPPPNAAPTANAGAPQTVPEGAVVTLDGSASTDPEGKPLTFSWEVTSTSPGAPPISISPATSAKPTFTAVDDGQYSIRLTVTDSAGATGTAETTVTVSNVGPEVTLVVADNQLNKGEAASGSGSFADPGSDQWTGTVDYGDGSGVQPLPLTPDKTFTIAHTYAAPGEFVITTCVTDDDGGKACANSILTVAAVYAMFTRKDTCTTPASIDWGGSRGRVTGDVHANGGLAIGGSNNVINGATTYRCDQVITGKGNKLSGGLNPVISAPPPHSPTRADFTCTYTTTGLLDLSKNGPWWVNGKSSSGTLASGTICAGEIKLSGTAVKGKVTLVATKISISASGAVLTPFDEGVIAFATGNSTEAIRIDSSNSSHAGALIAPSGGVLMGGTRNTISAGGVDAWTIKISGSDWKIAR